LIGNDLALQAARTGQLVLKTSGTQWRDFITLPDVVRGLTTLIDAEGADLLDGLFNLGGNLRLRIVDVANRVAEAAHIVLGQAPPVIRPEGDDDSPPTFEVPTTKIERLGFAPTADRFLRAELENAIRLVL
jgi:UDP-glucose 4-epimerase